jgi:hypothetical protein
MTDDLFDELSDDRVDSINGKMLNLALGCSD